MGFVFSCFRACSSGILKKLVQERFDEKDDGRLSGVRVRVNHRLVAARAATGG
jgi:hypothetical protein